MVASGGVARYAVVGNPVAHSLSPRIHAAFAEQTGQALSYEAIEIPLPDFAKHIRELQHDGYAGLNVTVPFKREAWELCDDLSERAGLAGAVNTLSFLADGRIAGDNTDGIGLIRDLVENLKLVLATRKILVLGAGGAVRGVLGPLLAQAPGLLAIANRTPQKAVALARDFAPFGAVEAVAFEALGDECFDLIINGTAAGLNDEIPPVTDKIIAADTVCYDMMYRLGAATAFVDWGQSHGAGQAYDGLGMLVEQAAEAFRIWRQVQPSTAGIIRSLRQA
ncbi:MAG: shikimate dehydrogenase [Gammaproteobacteria bacterium]|nr:shikimate dehydrogenase [Gammaproteobacteria bacterium]MDH3535261.1 shikimate dehydrogenase [Gammaproteobacteria bacterium]